MLAEDEGVPPVAPLAFEVDDVALISKALDALEADGNTPELAAGRQALRRLAALAL